MSSSLRDEPVSFFQTALNVDQTTICTITKDGTVEWSEDASPAEIMNPARLIDPNMRAAMIALWYATRRDSD